MTWPIQHQLNRKFHVQYVLLKEGLKEGQSVKNAEETDSTAMIHPNVTTQVGGVEGERSGIKYNQRLARIFNKLSLPAKTEVTKIWKYFTKSADNFLLGDGTMVDYNAKSGTQTKKETVLK